MNKQHVGVYEPTQFGVASGMPGPSGYMNSPWSKNEKHIHLKQDTLCSYKLFNNFFCDHLIYSLTTFSYS